MCVCIIIHGTWGKHSDFAFADSLFCRAIKGAAKVEIEFERFEWSGGNSSLERTEAAIRLRNFISSIPEARRPVYIIAHSHGGNVAIEAVHGDETEDRVGGVITLGTPFLSAEPRKLISLLATLPGRMSIFAMVFGLLLASILAVVAAFVGKLQPYYGMLGAITIVAIVVVAAKSPVSDLAEGAAAFAKRAAFDCSNAPRVPLRVNLLVIHSRADEALWWLQQVFSLTTLPFALLGAGLWILGWSTVGAVVLAFVGRVLQLFVEGDSVLWWLVIPMFFCLALGLALAATSLLLVALVKLIHRFVGTGPSAIFWSNVATRPRATRLPNFACEHLEDISAKIVNLYGGLWHSKYARSGAVVDQIAKRIDAWHLQMLSGRGAAAQQFAANDARTGLV